MSTWYKVERWNDNIYEVESVRETKNMIIVKNIWGESRESKTSRNYKYFWTKQEAIDFIRDRFVQKINILLEQLKTLDKDFKSFNEKYPQQGA